MTTSQNELQKVREELGNDQGSQNTFVLNGTFESRGNKIHSFFECNGCGAECSDETI